MLRLGFVAAHGHALPAENGRTGDASTRPREGSNSALTRPGLARRDRKRARPSASEGERGQPRRASPRGSWRRVTRCGPAAEGHGHLHVVHPQHDGAGRRPPGACQPRIQALRAGPEGPALRRAARGAGLRRAPPRPVPRARPGQADRPRPRRLRSVTSASRRGSKPALGGERLAAPPRRRAAPCGSSTTRASPGAPRTAKSRTRWAAAPISRRRAESRQVGAPRARSLAGAQPSATPALCRKSRPGPATPHHPQAVDPVAAPRSKHGRGSGGRRSRPRPRGSSRPWARAWRTQRAHVAAVDGPLRGLEPGRAAGYVSSRPEARRTTRPPPSRPGARSPRRPPGGRRAPRWRRSRARGRGAAARPRSAGRAPRRGPPRRPAPRGGGGRLHEADAQAREARRRSAEEARPAARPAALMPRKASRVRRGTRGS